MLQLHLVVFKFIVRAINRIDYLDYDCKKYILKKVNFVPYYILLIFKKILA